MESQLHRPAGHTNDQDPHSVGLHSVAGDEGEQHNHDNRSVMRKVKDKAKQIKHKLTKDGHGHEQEHEHEHEHERDYAHDDPDENEDDEDEEMVDDPEIHGAPMYETTAIRTSSPAQAQAVNLEKPTALGEDRYDHDPRRADRMMEGENVGLGLETSPEIGVLGDRQEDPGKILPPNYETKVADPSGGGDKEADMSPLIHSLEKTSVSSGKPGTEPPAQRAYTGSHDQFGPESTPIAGEFGPKTASTETVTGGKSSGESGYVEKLSVAASMIADKAISAKNAVASRLGYGGTEGGDKIQTEERKNVARTGASASPVEYVPKVASTMTEKLAPVYDKVAGAGSTVVSKVKGSTGGAGQGAAATEISGGVSPDKGVSVTEYLAERLKPGEEDKALSEVISDTLLHKKREDTVKSGESKPVGKVIESETVKSGESKPVGKVTESETVKSGESKPVGKVTESEEVRKDIGSGMENKREGEDAIAAGKESSGGGMVDRLKGAVSSWIGKGGEQENHPKGTIDSSPPGVSVSNQGPFGTAKGVEDEANIGHEPRLQESGN